MNSFILFPKLRIEIFTEVLHFTDSLEGRKIMRALWDYYKVDGVITTQYELKRKVTPTGSEREGPGEASFSMLKLQQIAKERDMFSSIESFTSGDEEDDDEYDDEDDDYFSDESYSLKTDEEEEDNGSSTYSSVWKRRRRERRYIRRRL